jgi:hypothetical protein
MRSTPQKVELASPEQGKSEQVEESSPESTNAQTLPLSGNSPFNNKGQRSKYRRQLGPHGEQKKNFYNPPGKVMRHMA